MRKGKRIKDFEVDSSDIKVPFDELLYDIIFVIIISKITEILFAADVLEVRLIISGLIMFGSLVSIWIFRLNTLNKIHILQHKLKDYTLKSERMTYVEIVGLVVVLYSIKSFSYVYIARIFTLVLLLSYFSVARIRRRIIENAETHSRFHEIHKPGTKPKRTKVVNVEYIYERFGVLFVLFMGEILSAGFTTSDDIGNFLIISVLVVSIFNQNIKILKASKQYVEAHHSYDVYRFTIRYAKALLSLLLCLLISIESSNHFKFSAVVIIGVLVVYYLFESKMKRSLNMPFVTLPMVVNLLALLMIVLNVQLQLLIKFGFGVIVFVINMFLTE